MCLICIELGKGSLSAYEADRNLGEMFSSLDPDHVEEVERKIREHYFEEEETERKRRLACRSIVANGRDNLVLEVPQYSSELLEEQKQIFAPLWGDDEPSEYWAHKFERLERMGIQVELDES